MDPAGTVVGFALCSTIFISLATLFLLWRVPSSPTRNLAIVLMVVIIPASALMLLGLWEGPGGGLLYTASVSNLLIYWSLPLIFQLTLMFTRPKGFDFKAAGKLAIYLPMFVLTVLLGLMTVANHSEITVVMSSAPPFVVLGALNLMFIGFGVLYLILVIFLISWKLWSGAGPIKKSLQMMLGIFLSATFAGLLLMLLNTDISISALFTVVGSLLGLVLSNAAITRSILIVPQKEEPTVEAPIETLARGATYLYLGDKEPPRELFARLAKSGREGLWITRKHPREARERYGLVKTPFIWLTGNKVEGEVCLDPREFGALSAVMVNFIGKAKDFVILFEGLEYISTTASFESTMRLVQFLNDKVMSANGILMVLLSPEVFKPNELALLSSEAAQVFTGAEAWAGGKAATSRARPSPGTRVSISET
jgi:hypothetical protein